MTQAGVILGTAAYMAPEQAKGRAVDRRADIWAFGCVVFEMLAGRRAFSGDSVTDVLASVLTREPDWKALPADLPDSLRRLLRRCLQKDPRQRLHDLADARLEIDDAMAAPPPNAPAARWAQPLAYSASVRFFSWRWGLGWSRSRGWQERVPETTRPLMRPQRLTDMVGLEETPALSPDGRIVERSPRALNGKRQRIRPISRWRRSRCRSRKRLVDHQFPRWTPASSSVVYFSPAARRRQSGHALRNSSPRRARPGASWTASERGDVRASDSAARLFPALAGTTRARHVAP